jgi:hypothetical protein
MGALCGHKSMVTQCVTYWANVGYQRWPASVYVDSEVLQLDMLLSVSTTALLASHTIPSPTGLLWVAVLR